MKNTAATKKKRFEQDIFVSGEYVQHFKPEDKRNPFSNIYNQKKQDTINIINRYTGRKAILDMGGGMGRISLVLAATTQHDVILSDISVDMLKLAESNVGNLPNLEFVNTDAHQLPYGDNVFDIIVGLDLLCHLRNPEKALGEFNRVLRKNGILILDSTNSNPLWALFYPRYLGKNPLNWLKVLKFEGVLPGWENIVRHYPQKKFFSFLKKTGFEITQTINYGPFVCPKWHLAVSKKII
ncbi:class I SAM-dependent methyltransferase [Thermodesulfobacteriota bacterium]